MTITSQLVGLLNGDSTLASASAGAWITVAPPTSEIGPKPAIVVQLRNAPEWAESFDDSFARQFTYEVGCTGDVSQAAETTAIVERIYDLLHDVEWSATGWVISDSRVIDLLESSPRLGDSQSYNLGVVVQIIAQRTA